MGQGIALPKISKADAQTAIDFLFQCLEGDSPGLGLEVEVMLMTHYVSQGAKLGNDHLYLACREQREALALACLDDGVKPKENMAKAIITNDVVIEAMIERGLKLTEELMAKGLCHSNPSVVRHWETFTGAKKQALADKALNMAMGWQFELETVEDLVALRGAMLKPSVFAEHCYDVHNFDSKSDAKLAYLVLQGADYNEKYNGRSAKAWAKYRKMVETLDAIERMERASTFQKKLSKVADKTRKGAKRAEPSKPRVM